MNDVSIRTIRWKLQQRVGELAPMLAPGGHERAGLYEAPNPTRADRSAGSFKVYMRGDAAGKWVDFAGVNAPFAQGGDRGDIIDLIAYCRCGRDRKKAIAWAKDFLGLATLPMAERERLDKLAQAAKLRTAAKHKNETEEKMRRACELFMSARIGLAGTPAAAYLLNDRGIDLIDIPFLVTGDIRFHPGLEYYQGAVYDDVGGRRVKVRPGPSFPAIVSGFRNRVGAVTGCHITYLRPDGGGKAEVDKPKIMYGVIADSLVRVSHGQGGLSPEDIRHHGVPGDFAGELPDTIIAEGLEDSLTLAVAAPEARVWMAGSLGNIGNVYLDHPCVRDVIVARDNDWQSPQAVKQFEHAMRLLEAHGKPITEMAAIAGKDFNDLLRL
jgi:hypothetical protein